MTALQLSGYEQLETKRTIRDGIVRYDTASTGSGCPIQIEDNNSFSEPLPRKERVCIMKKKVFIVLLILLTTLYISQNLYQLNLIQGDSMYPAYKNMQFTLIDKRAADFQCGDVIVFYCPTLNCTMVKRIIAVSGETVLISEGAVLVNGIQSPYIYDSVAYAGSAADALLVGDKQFFVMGDNHAQSKDSRYAEIGCIRLENIIGRIIPNRLPLCASSGI